MASETAKRGGSLWASPSQPEATPRRKSKLKPRLKKSPVKKRRVGNQVKDEAGGSDADPAGEPCAGLLQVAKGDARDSAGAYAGGACENAEMGLKLSMSDGELDADGGDACPPFGLPPDGQVPVCTACQEQSGIDWDDVDGLYVCHNCGQCIDVTETGAQLVVPGEEQLVNDTPYDPRGKQYGVVSIGEENPRSWVAIDTMLTPRSRRVGQYASSYDARVPIRKFVREFGNHLKLRKPVIEEAMGYAFRIYESLPSRSMKLQMMSLSGVYVAIRMNQLPLTLVDLAEILPKGGVSVFAIGRSYRQCLLALQLQVPTMDPAGLIPKLFDTWLRKNEKADMDGPTQTRILSDAKMLAAFISRTEARAQHPTVLAATSIYLGIEMNMLPVPRVQDVAQAFSIGETALKVKANNVRHVMTSMGRYLPFGENIEAKNVMKYARVLLKLSMLKSRAEAEGAAVQPCAPDAVKAAIAQAIADETRNAGEGDEMDQSDVDDDLEDVDVDEYLRTQDEVEELARLNT